MLRLAFAAPRALLRPLSADISRLAPSMSMATRADGTDTRPATGFIRFAAGFSRKPEMKSVKPTERMRQAGQAWKALPSEQKEVLQKAFEEDLAVYNAKRDKEIKPKAPTSAYAIYVQKHADKDKSITDVAKEWKALTEAQRNKLAAEYAPEIAANKELLAKWSKKHGKGIKTAEQIKQYYIPTPREYLLYVQRSTATGHQDFRTKLRKYRVASQNRLSPRRQTTIKDMPEDLKAEFRVLYAAFKKKQLSTIRREARQAGVSNFL